MAFEYFPPELGKGDYHCPYCNVYAKQSYAHLTTLPQSGWSSVVDGQTKFQSAMPRDWIVTKCGCCEQVALWIGNGLIVPERTTAPPPNNDLGDDIKRDYSEAATVYSKSPRAAAALLRLALQKLCVQLGESGENINCDIGSLVTKGLNPLVQKSLDALRITGNNAVHPGEINLDEEPHRVAKLFELINFIVQKMITEPRELEAFYAELPSGAIDAVKKRDGNTPEG